MSKQDYVRIAAVLRAEHAIASDEGCEHHIENVVASLADVFLQDNPRFDRATFYGAALGRGTVRA